MTRNPRLADVGMQANLLKASAAGHTQARRALLALAVLREQRPSAHRDRWIRALQQRIDNPDGTLADLGRSMTPPMTKHAYAALLRRALRGGGIGSPGGDVGNVEGSRSA